MCALLAHVCILHVFVTSVVLTRADKGNETYTVQSTTLNQEITTASTFSFTPTSIIPKDTTPFSAFSGLYSECFMSLSYSCFQRKLLIFLDRLDKQRKISVYGHWLELVRVSEPQTPAITEDLLIARKATDEKTLSSLLDGAFEQFVDNRIIRFNLPDLDENVDIDNKRSMNYIDLNISGHSSAEVEGRGKKKKVKKLAKILKKVFLILGKLVAIKLILLKPILLKLLLIKALLALMMGKMGFMMSMGMMVSKLMGNKRVKMLFGGGGGGGCSCGGGKGGGKGCGCDSYAPSGVSDAEWSGGGGGSSGWDSSGGGGGGGGVGGWMSAALSGGGGGGGGGGWERSFAHNAAYSHYAQNGKSSFSKGDTEQLSNSSHNSVQSGSNFTRNYK